MAFDHVPCPVRGRGVAAALLHLGLVDPDATTTAWVSDPDGSPQWHLTTSCPTADHRVRERVTVSWAVLAEADDVCACGYEKPPGSIGSWSDVAAAASLAGWLRARHRAIDDAESVMALCKSGASVAGVKMVRRLSPVEAQTRRIVRGDLAAVAADARFGSVRRRLLVGRWAEWERWRELDHLHLPPVWDEVSRREARQIVRYGSDDDVAEVFATLAVPCAWLLTTTDELVHAADLTTVHLLVRRVPVAALQGASRAWHDDHLISLDPDVRVTDVEALEELAEHTDGAAWRRRMLPALVAARLT